MLVLAVQSWVGPVEFGPVGLGPVGLGPFELPWAGLQHRSVWTEESCKQDEVGRATRCLRLEHSS